MRVNLGCGQAYMDGWLNVDASTDVRADVHMDAAEFVRQYGPEIDEVYLGHVIEHLMPDAARSTLRMLNERLRPGVIVSAVVPDMSAIFAAYAAGEIGNEQLNAAFVYSYVQPSRHVWCHDAGSLQTLFREVGFTEVDAIDPLTWPPVYHKQGPESRWQCGVKGVATGAVAGVPAAGDRAASAQPWAEEAEAGSPSAHADGDAAQTSGHEQLLARVRDLREQLLLEAERRRDLEHRVAQLQQVAAPALPAATAPPAGSPSPVWQNGDAARHGIAVAAGSEPPDLAAGPGGFARALRRGDVSATQVARVAAEKALPRGSTRRARARAALVSAQDAREFTRHVGRVWAEHQALPQREPSYRSFCKDHDASRGDLRRQRELSETVSAPTHFEVVVVDRPGESLQDTIDSLRTQSWQHWHVSVCSGSATAPQVRHPQLTLVTREGAGLAELVNYAVGDAALAARRGSATPVSGPDEVDAADAAADDVAGAAAQNESSLPAPAVPAAGADPVAAAGATFVLLLDAGDRLAPDCLFQLHLAAHADPLVDLITFDDDRLDAKGERFDPRFRPAWSPEMLLGANYLGRSFAMRRRRWLFIEGLREGFADAAVWDLLLRAQLTAERVCRVPRVLAHVRRRPDQVDTEGARVVADHLSRQGRQAGVSIALQSLRIAWEPEVWPHVTIVIPTRHNRDMLTRCLPSLTTTAYPSFDVAIVDNGGRSQDNELWYDQYRAETGGPLDLTVTWWDEPFNYSAVNNRAAASARGDVLVFLNDDTEVLDPGWLRELVGWAVQPEIGVAGLQLLAADGTLQHAGAILGLGGFADHVFEGMLPGSPSMLGPTGWYRDVLAVTGACLAVRRELFEQWGGFDERFVLCGSDVALGLDSIIDGYRNVCSPFAAVRHLESATRGRDVPTGDFFASYWRYNTWLFGGDPYYSPNLSLDERIPRLRSKYEPTPGQRLSGPLGRSFEAFRQKSDAGEARMLADLCRARPSHTEAVRALHRQNADPFPIRTINWYIPDIDSPFYGGINTALRMADYLARQHGVQNRFVVWGNGPDYFVRSALAAAFPSLQDSEIVFYQEISEAGLAAAPPADASIATLWVSAYAVAKAQDSKRKFYLIQDFEPMFYAAGTQYALAEHTYRLGLYGLCNTPNLGRVYRTEYGGTATSFIPAVDPRVFHAHGRPQHTADAPVTVFVYARPGHWRNCWEMASLALEQLKERLGERVRIVTAGAWAVPEDSHGGIRHLGLLDYRATGNLYRTCDVGLALTLSKHPSYLPLELMACGVPIVAFDNPWGHWILRHEQNALLAERTVDDLVDKLDRLVSDAALRRRLAGNATADIAARHGSWDAAFSGIYEALCDPEGSGAREAAGEAVGNGEVLASADVTGSFRINPHALPVPGVPPIALPR